jgi:hypothetical protein
MSTPTQSIRTEVRTIDDEAIRFAETKQFKVKAVTPSFWEVTFINPPINLIDGETIQQLNGLLADIEADRKLTADESIRW